MRKTIVALSVLLASPFFSSYSEAFSFSASHSGSLNSEGWYYYCVYQNVYLYNGQVMSETHSFTFSGALSDDSNPTLLGLNDNWLIYEGKKHYIAIPSVSGESIYVKRKNSMNIPSPNPCSGKIWQRISDPVK